MDGVLGEFRERIRGRSDRTWAGSVDDLLFDGETVRRTVSLGDNRVVVTSHRVLAFTPDRAGENYRQADVPNVTDVRTGHEGEENLVFQAARTFVYGVALLAVGLLFDFATLVPTDVFGEATGATGRLGLGGLIGIMQQFLTLIGLIDDFARLVGALLVLLGVFITAVYLFTRDRVVVVSLAGEEGDILVPGDEDDVEEAVTQLERALFDPGSDAPGKRAARDAGLKSDDPL